MPAADLASGLERFDRCCGLLVGGEQRFGLPPLVHTIASLLKDLQVPARDAQAILGHTRISTALEIFSCAVAVTA